MNKICRGKFKLQSITDFGATTTYKTLTFYAVSNDGTPENERFHKYTPSGEIKMNVDNPIVTDNMKIGKSYYVDFIEVEQK